MKLTVSTPTSVVEEVDELHCVRAEDETGSFGIMPGHADFVTVLPVTVVRWTAMDGREGFVLVRQGVMTVSDGKLLEIAARDAFRNDELRELGETVTEVLRQTDEMEDVARKSDTRMHIATIRQVEKMLREGRGPKETAPPRLEGRGQASREVAS